VLYIVRKLSVLKELKENLRYDQKIVRYGNDSFVFWHKGNTGTCTHVHLFFVIFCDPEENSKTVEKNKIWNIVHKERRL